MAMTDEEKLKVLDSLEDAAWANLQFETNKRQYDRSDQHLQHIQLVAQVRDRIRSDAKLVELEQRLKSLEVRLNQ